MRDILFGGFLILMLVGIVLLFVDAERVGRKERAAIEHEQEKYNAFMRFLQAIRNARR